MTTARKKDPLGRLRSFGVQEPWQTALLLPHSWDDLRYPQTEFVPAQFLVGDKALVVGRLAGKPQFRRDRMPRLTGTLQDRQGREVRFTVFGDTRTWQSRLSAQDPAQVALYGKVGEFDRFLTLSQPDIVPRQWMNRLRPRYPGKTGVINADTVRERVAALLPDALAPAADWLREHAGATPDVLARLCDWQGSLEQMLELAHWPDSEATGHAAQHALERIAAWQIARQIRQSTPAAGSTPRLGPFRSTQSRLSSLPFQLTDDQLQALREILQDLGSGRPMHRILNGDVGTGKTAVFAVATACLADAGGRTAILLPTDTLARQVAAEFAEWWNDLDVGLLTGDCKPGQTAPRDRQILIGTTALLHRDCGERDLVVVDEQHKYSRDQREKLKAPHLLEASATCIPRSQALLRHGVVKLSRLDEGHASRQIETRLWGQENLAHRRQVFAAVRESLQKKAQVLILYPRREEMGIQGRNAVESALVHWQRHFGDQVVHAHGRRSQEENQAALDAMRSGAASILVATTVVEVGLNLPGLRHAVVVDAGRLGLTQLHQIRGRLARLGGWGRFDLLAHTRKAETLDRLMVLTRTTDGFTIAEADLELRGFGDIRADGNKQSGADETFLFGRPLRPHTLEQVLHRHGDEHRMSTT